MRPFPRILLIGRTGQVGWELHRTLSPLGELISVDYPEIDLAAIDSICRWIRDTRPEIVVNAAAYTAVDKAEAEPALAMKINGVAPGIMADEVRKLDALLVHYSTDYVFDGARAEPCREDQPAAPMNMYGRSKNVGDEAIIQSGVRHLIFRLCWVYGLRGSNFLLTILRLGKEREQLRVVHDQVGCPTWLRLIAVATALALKTVMDSADRHQFTGTYHLCAQGQTSWHDFAEAIVASMPQGSLKCRIVEAISSAEYPAPARRPSYSVLSTDKLHRTFGLRLPHWKDSLGLVREEMNVR